MSTTSIDFDLEAAYTAHAGNPAFWEDLRNNDPMCKVFIDYVLGKPQIPIDPTNPIFKTDSYKLSQFNMFNDVKPDKNGNMQTLIKMYAFIEPRKGARDSHVVVAGTQNIVNTLTDIKVTIHHVKQAIWFCNSHFSTPTHSGKYHFNPLPWLKVALCYNGNLPIKLSAIHDGTIVPVGIPICIIESTDEDCAQLVSHYEGLIQKAYWYPTTVATNALGFSTVIKIALKVTATDEVISKWLKVAIQDFGYRGCTSEDAAIIGGSAALYLTEGSDTVSAVVNTMVTMGDQTMTGYSVAACEHNQAFCRGRDGESDFVSNLCDLYPSGIISVVADTFDTLNHIEMITTGDLKVKIMARDGTWVIRPDSQLLNEDGTEMSPAETISAIFEVLNKNLSESITTNDKGFKVLPSQYKIIYGDGLNIPKIKAILDVMIRDGWCATNIVFGVGGNLLQNINRDTERFAMKSSQQMFKIRNVDGTTRIETRNVGKETPGKESKRGMFHVGIFDGIIQCNSIDDPKVIEVPNMLFPYFINGNICKSFDDLKTIRERINFWREQYQI